jgi:hypothetical protein
VIAGGRSEVTTPIVPLINQVQAQTKGTITETSLELAQDLTIEEWKQLGNSLARVENATNWWLGDWWAYGEHCYGDRKDLISQDDWTGPSFETCMAAGSVCRAFKETSRRRQVLSFSHHREVAPLRREVADKLLDWCEEPLKSGGKRPRSVKDLRVRVKEIRAEAEIKEMRADGFSQRDTAAMLGVSVETVRKCDASPGDEISKTENSRDERSSYTRIKDQITAERELGEETQYGITVKEAMKRLGKLWINATKDQNDRAKRFLAGRLVHLIFNEYPDLRDEVLSNES